MGNCKLLALVVALVLSLVLFALSVEGATKPVDKDVPASEAEGKNQRVRYTASWAVQIDGGGKMADTIAKRNGFRNRGKVRVREDVREWYIYFRVTYIGIYNFRL